MTLYSDVSPDDWFFEYVEWMSQQGIANGYLTNPPCTSGTPCFMPGNNATRGQMTKIVILAFDIPINTGGGSHFADVPAGSTFYEYVETGFKLGLWSGYADGTFKPADIVTRGQAAKIVVNAAILVDLIHWTLENPPTNTFEDVPVGSTFFRHIETAVSHGIVSGYQCGTPGPCVPPLNKPYFAPDAEVTRAQISKITFLAANYGR